MTTPAANRLFVYGSLRKGFHSPAYEYISRYFTFESDARVRGKLYDMGQYPAGVPCTEECFIVGELYRVTNDHELSWAIGQLDDYEGMSVEEGEKPLYIRELTEVVVNGEHVMAWIYWFNGEVAERPVIESGDMLEYLKLRK